MFPAIGLRESDCEFEDVSQRARSRRLILDLQGAGKQLEDCDCAT
jgi:hypothetical protein